jgi:DNA repair protein RadC
MAKRRIAMLTWEDCIGLVELTEEEIAAIALHEHLPQLAALELGNYLVEHEGCHKIKRMIVEDLEAAHRAHDPLRVLTLKVALKHFVDCHRVRLAAEAAGSPISNPGDCAEIYRVPAASERDLKADDAA